MVAIVTMNGNTGRQRATQEISMGRTEHHTDDAGIRK